MALVGLLNKKVAIVICKLRDKSGAVGIFSLSAIDFEQELLGDVLQLHSLEGMNKCLGVHWYSCWGTKSVGEVSA